MNRPPRPPAPGIVAQSLAVAVATGVPPILWGGPGEGKTAMVRQLARAAGRHCEVVVGATHEAVDFSGLPVRTDAGVAMVAPAWAQRLATAPAGLLFLDELSSAPPTVRAAMLGVVHDRTVGDLVLPPSVAVVAAANPPELASDGWDLDAPMANRLCHLWFETDVATWTAGLTGGWPEPAALVMRGETETVTVWRTLVAAFIRARPALLRRVPDSVGERGGPWPSPRSWDLAARLADTAGAGGCPEEVVEILLSGCVGEAAATELLAFADASDLPDPEDVLADPALVDDVHRPDRLLTVLAGVVAAVEARASAGRWEAAWEVVARVGRRGQLDVAAHAARGLARLRPDRSWVLPRCAHELVPVLAGAGLLKK